MNMEEINHTYVKVIRPVTYTSAGHTSDCYRGRKQTFPAGSFVCARWLTDKKITVLTLLNKSGNRMFRYALESAPEIRNRVRRILK